MNPPPPCRSPLHYYNALLKFVKMDKNGQMVSDPPATAVVPSTSQQPVLKIAVVPVRKPAEEVSVIAPLFVIK